MSPPRGGGGQGREGGGYRYDASNCVVCEFTLRKRFDKFRHGTTETFEDQSRRGKKKKNRRIERIDKKIGTSTCQLVCPPAASLMLLVQHLVGIFANLAKKPDGASALALAFQH